MITDECSDIGSDTTFSNWDRWLDIIRSSDCRYVISGSTGKTILMEIDEDGNELWSRTYGGISGSHWGNSVKQTSDGGYIIGAAQNTSLRQTQKVGKSGIKSCRIQYIIMSKM